ncbi:hypothetical protein ACIP93_31790 [Streptomyces sp. NPDC088745]|uniref:hypothetical protein n=1 Tax=Streptomyces sp. NPDC088745 TaxID=3365884 RepID=UPI00380F7595
MLVAVDERDLAFVPEARGSGQSFSLYWHSVHARAEEALTRGEQPLLAPLVDFAYIRACNDAGLDPRSKAGFNAYAGRLHPVDELWPFAGESPEAMLREMRREQSAWAMMIRCQKVFGAAHSRFGPQAEAWARDCSTRVLHALIDEVHGGDAPSTAAYGLVTLVAKAAGLELGAYSLAVEAGPKRGVQDRDRERFAAALGASLIAGAKGVLTLEIGDARRVQVWELADQRLTPSEHGQLLLEPDGHDALQPQPVYVPGPSLPQPI